MQLYRVLELKSNAHDQFWITYRHIVTSPDRFKSECKHAKYNPIKHEPITALYLLKNTILARNCKSK